jgi:hypothetical protein
MEVSRTGLTGMTVASPAEADHRAEPEPVLTPPLNMAVPIVPVISHSPRTAILRTAQVRDTTIH